MYFCFAYKAFSTWLGSLSSLAAVLGKKRTIHKSWYLGFYNLTVICTSATALLYSKYTVDENTAQLPVLGSLFKNKLQPWPSSYDFTANR